MNQQEIVLILFQVIVLVLAFSVHESAHAYVAMKLGDPTAYMLGRVTLNPMKHMDPWGSVAIPLMSLYFGGFLIGFGSRYAGGCVSGHSMTGISDLQWTSVLATAFIFAGGIFTSYILLPLILKL